MLSPPSLLGPPHCPHLASSHPHLPENLPPQSQVPPGTPVSRSHDAPKQPQLGGLRATTPSRSSPFTLMGGHVSSHGPTSLQPSHAPWPDLCTHYVALKGPDSSKTEFSPLRLLPTPAHAQTCSGALIYSHLTVEATVIPPNPPLPVLAPRLPRLSPSHQFQTFQLLGTGASSRNPI